MIFLASTSAARRRLLEQAGLNFSPAQPDFDEDRARRDARRAGKSIAETALILAEGKALSVAGRFVIGADQMLECDGAWFDKPADRAAAKAQLLALRGRTHTLQSAVALTSGGVIVWSAGDRARLSMRDFSQDFLEDYLDRAGDAVLRSVGAYHLEGLGAQLFDKVEGDFFTILGLPLIPLLAELRRVGAIRT